MNNFSLLTLSNFLGPLQFLSGPSQKIFCFSSALTRFLSTTQVQIPKIRVASPKTRHAVTVLFWPLERQKTPEFRGFFGVASFKMCKHGTPEGIRTPDLLVRSQTLYPAELLALLSTSLLYSLPRQMSRVCFNFSVKFQQRTTIGPQNRHRAQRFAQ